MICVFVKVKRLNSREMLPQETERIVADLEKIRV
jgi:hypothetical protein